MEHEYKSYCQERLTALSFLAGMVKRFLVVKAVANVRMFLKVKVERFGDIASF